MTWRVFLGRLAPRIGLIGFLLLPWLAAAPSAAAKGEGASTVLTTRVEGTISPVVAEQLTDAVRTAESNGNAALLVELDTPGGLLTSTRDIVQTFLTAQVPIIVYVSPSGGRAGSAGAYITLASHVAAMAPGTNIGAATPVGGQGEDLDQKVVNDSAAWAVSIAERRDRDTKFAEDMVRKGRSVPASEAVDIGAVDLEASSRGDLLAQVNGRTATLGDGQRVTLRTADVNVAEYQPNFFRGLLQMLAHPELAYLFVSIGTLGIIYELASPGVGIAGITGSILLILGFFSLSVLPFNVAGLLLLLLAAALFLAEVLTPGVGVFAAGGSVSLVLAGFFLFEGQLGVNPAVLWPTAVVVGVGTLIAGRLAWRARKATPVTGGDVLVGRDVVVQRVDQGVGQVQLEGSWWTVRSHGARLKRGQTVRVVGREDLDLIVEPVESGKD